MKELMVKKCEKCGTILRIFGKQNEMCEITCCGEKMKNLEPNSVDAAIEKHVPAYEIVENELVVKVNHVMEEEHFIEWICVVNSQKEITTILKPGMEATVTCEYAPGTMLYAYCNKHGLWKSEVK